MPGDIPPDVSHLEFETKVPPEFTAVDEALTSMKEAREGFVGACEDYFASPCQDAHEFAVVSAGNLPSTFEDSLNSIYATMGSDSTRAAHGLYVRELSELAEKINGILSEQVVVLPSPSDIETFIADTVKESETEEELITAIQKGFSAAISDILHSFVGNIREHDTDENEGKIRIVLGDVALRGTHPDTLRASYYLPFAIEPPLQNVHDSQFMGPAATLDYDDSDATYGKFWIRSKVNVDSDQQIERVQEQLESLLRRELNPFGEKEIEFEHPSQIDEEGDE